MRKYVIPAWLILLSMILGGCSSDYLHFTGASDHWKGEYKVNLSENKEDGEFIFKYKKDEKEINIKNFSVMVDDERGTKQDILKEKTVKLENRCSGCAVTTSDHHYKVVIKWDGHEESFYMKNK
jgi:hypothetical protein